MNGLDLVKRVTPKEPYAWTEGRGAWTHRRPRAPRATHHVVAIDYGIKRNILRCLVDAGCRVTVVPGDDDRRRRSSRSQPDGVFLSNGPGDPAAVSYAVETRQRPARQEARSSASASATSCSRSRSARKTYKLKFGHRGANQPVKDLTTGRIEITTQNHGFCVDLDVAPDGRRSPRTCT